MPFCSIPFKTRIIFYDVISVLIERHWWQVVLIILQEVIFESHIFKNPEYKQYKIKFFLKKDYLLVQRKLNIISNNLQISFLFIIYLQRVPKHNDFHTLQALFQRPFEYTQLTFALFLWCKIICTIKCYSITCSHDLTYSLSI